MMLPTALAQRRTPILARAAVVGWTISQGLLSAAATDLLSRRPGRKHVAWYRGLPALIERLGPAWIKFAQIASTRQDMLPAAVCDVLAVLHSEVTPMSAAQLDTTLTQALGDDWRSTLLDLEPVAVGSGSIACVYRARLADGAVVAVKVRRPDVAELVTADIRLIQSCLDLLNRTPWLSRLPISEMGQAVGATVLGQLDLHAEAHNLAALGQTLESLEFVRLPKPYLALCSQSCLVMEFVPGLEAHRGRELISAERRSELTRQILVAVYTMLFRTGLVHCDLHPGNLRLTTDDTIALLDAGFTYQISAPTRTSLALFFLHLAMRNSEGCTAAVLSSARHIPPDADLPGFSADMDLLVKKYGGAKSAEFDLPAFAAELFQCQQRRRIFAPPDFVFPLVSLLMIETTIKGLDPSTDFQAIARPIISECLLGEIADDAAGDWSVLPRPAEVR